MLFCGHYLIKPVNMYRLKVLNRVRMAYVPAAVIAGAAATVSMASCRSFGVVYAKKEAPPPPPEDCDPNKPLLRAKDLPIYYKPNEEEQQKICKEETEVYPDDRLMGVVKVARKTLWEAYDQLGELKVKAKDTVGVGIAHFDETLTKLREPENANYRYTAIAGGGLFGFILSWRGGAIRRFVYTSTGALSMAALCYPDEARQYSEEILKYGSIALHFLNAAVKDLADVDLAVPEFSKLVPIDRIFVWITSTDDGKVSKSSPSSVTLLPPSAETPSHVVPLLSVHPGQSGGVPMPPLDRPTSMSQSVKAVPLRDQSNPMDKDMYSLRG